MATFALTGRASDRRGNFIERRDLIAHLGNLHHGFHDGVYSYTDYLVASRTDTTKARNARALGVRVISYNEMWDILDGTPQFRPSMPVSPGAAQPRYIPPSTPRPVQSPEPELETGDRWNRVRKISI